LKDYSEFTNNLEYRINISNKLVDELADNLIWKWS